jgi:Rrf2 family protein
MFSKATEYALRATIYIAKKSTLDKKIGIEEISNAIGSPQSFTAKILQLLTKENKLISSLRGPNGGFFLSDEARKMPLRSILIAMGEDDILEKCVLGLKQCSEIHPCPMHNEYKSIKRQLIKLFVSKTIQQVADDMKDGEIHINSLLTSS